MRARDLHPLIRGAGKRGELPGWGLLKGARLAHSKRVAEVMEGWALELGLRKVDRHRWRAAAMFHDSLKAVPPRRLRKMLSGGDRRLPGPVLHGPACARTLADEGVDDRPLLLAVAYHTTGHPDLDLLGKALYVADYVEPGRRSGAKRRAAFRSRFPADHAAVVVDVAALKIGALIHARLAIPPITARFWRSVLDHR